MSQNMNIDDKTIIRFIDIKKSFQNIEALKGISFSIQKGDIFGYIGPNGAGKTTTFKILVGLLKKYSGNFIINGKEVNGQNDRNKLIGYMPQDVGFQSWRTVEQMLKTFGMLSGVRKEILESKIDESLALVGLNDSKKRKIKYLSGGMKQKLKLAQALLHDPPILVLDEPMSGLDPTSRFQMKNIIRELSKRDVTIIFSSHILSDVEDITNKICIINNGQIVKLGTRQELQNELIGGNILELKGKNLHDYSDTLKNLPSIMDVKIDDKDKDKINLTLTDNSEVDIAIQEVLESLIKHKINIRHLNYLTPSLEQIYLKYTEGGNVK